MRKEGYPLNPSNRSRTTIVGIKSYDTSQVPNSGVECFPRTENL